MIQKDNWKWKKKKKNEASSYKSVSEAKKQRENSNNYKSSAATNEQERRTMHPKRLDPTFHSKPTKNQRSDGPTRKPNPPSRVWLC